MADELNVTANADAGSDDAELDAFLAEETGDTGAEVAEEPQLDEFGQPLDELNSIPEDLVEEEPAVPVEGEAQPAEQPEQAPGEQLPEGVEKATDDKGREYFKLRKNRYEAFHGAHKALKALEPIFGQPLTAETAPQVVGQAVADAQGWANFRADFLSGEPQAQAGVLNFLFDRAQQAVQRGEVQGDPLVPFSEQFVTQLRERNFAAYAKVAAPAVQDVISELYQDAVNSNNENLLRAIQHVDHKINGQFRTADDIKQGLDPSLQRERILQQREQRLQQEESRRQHETWQQWTNFVQRNEEAQVNAALDAALKDEAPKLEKYPELLAGIKDSLRNAVYADVRADAQLQNAIALGMQQARRAANPSVRDNIASQLIGRVINRAQLVIADKKAQMIRERTRAFKAQNDATHQRRQQAARQTAPSGGGTPVRRSAVPNGNVGDYEVATADRMYQDAIKALGL